MLPRYRGNGHADQGQNATLKRGDQNTPPTAMAISIKLKLLPSRKEWSKEGNIKPRTNYPK